MTSKKTLSHFHFDFMFYLIPFVPEENNPALRSCNLCVLAYCNSLDSSLNSSRSSWIQS